MSESSERYLEDDLRMKVSGFKSGIFGTGVARRCAEKLLEAYPDKAEEIITYLLQQIARDARTMLSLSCPFLKTQPERYY